MFMYLKGNQKDKMTIVIKYSLKFSMSKYHV